MKKISLDDFADIVLTHGPVLCGVYVIKHLKTGWIYVGSANNLYKRKTRNISALRNNKHHSKSLQAAYNDSSELEFSFIITETREEAYDFEQQILDDPSILTQLFNKSFNARLANKGVPVPIEVKEHLSRLNLGKKLSEETKGRIAKAGRGRKHSEETKEKISLLLKGKKRTPEQLERYRIARQTQSHRVCILGVEYESIGSAARALSMHKLTIRRRCKNSNFPDWFYL